jgi:penicillin-binding protein 1A
MVKLIKIIFYASLLACVIAMSSVIATYFYLKPNLPEISLVNESQLQLPLKIYTQDKVLIGEYGEIKRRPVVFNEIPNDLKNAFLAAEDDRFFEHQGISYTGIIRSFIRCVGPNGCLGGGGTISMQVVRGYVLTRDQTIVRKLKEIYLAYELEGRASKEEIFELYVNRIFLGNRSYGIQAASNTYFNKSVDQLTLSESATIAALAQLPSVINPIKSPLRTKQRRNWILSRMLKLNLISKSQYTEALNEEVKVVKNIDLYEVDAKYLAELARQEIIKRFGLKAYKEGWNVYTTINSSYQTAANKSIQKHLADYDKRHGWRLADNYKNIFNNQQMEFLSQGSSDFLKENMEQASSFDSNSNVIGSRVSDIFSSYPYYESHAKGIVAGISDNELLFVDENLDIQTINWSSRYNWARKQIDINTRDRLPNGFNDFLNFGDFIYLIKAGDLLFLDQLPIAESALISANPNTGAIRAYVGGSNFNKSNFDRVRLSYPQSGSSFKPFIYASALSNEYNLSSLINDAPIAFKDDNLESVWRPQNYTGKFYGLTPLRSALIRSINIVSIKLLREVGIQTSSDTIENFGFERERLPKDLSLALGSGNFSPAEMVRAFGVIASEGYITDPYYIDKIEDRFGNIIFSSQQTSQESKDLIAFPWLNTLEMDIKKPYYLVKPINRSEKVIDERVAYLIKDTLKDFMKNGTAGRKSAFLNRDDIGGKTGTTNDAISTWFSGFHDDLVTTVWVGTDDFTSLGENEYGSTISMPIWLDYMSVALDDLQIKPKTIPSNLSYVKVNKATGKVDKSQEAKNTYFELFLDENIKD